MIAYFFIKLKWRGKLSEKKKNSGVRLQNSGEAKSKVRSRMLELESSHYYYKGGAY
jgi:hypothetical protein